MHDVVQHNEWVWLVSHMTDIELVEFDLVRVGSDHHSVLASVVRVCVSLPRVTAGLPTQRGGLAESAASPLPGAESAGGRNIQSDSILVWVYYGILMISRVYYVCLSTG